MRRSLLLLLLSFSLPLAADPTVLSITPRSSLIAGGTIVHFHGTNLFAGTGLCGSPLGCMVFVKFGDTLGGVIYDSADEVVVVAPPHAAGSVDLVVTVPFNQPLTLKNAFTYEDAGGTTVRLLLPIAAGTQGNFNTSWKTDILAHNETTSSIDVAGTTIPPISTRPLTPSPSSTGMFLQIPRSAVNGLTITTHVHDATHDAESLGVDVPSIPETQFRQGVVLTGIPNDSRYRVLLRAYGYPGTYSFVVRIRDDQTGALLDRQTLFDPSSSDLRYVQMPIAAAAASSTLRVEVSTAEPFDPPIWAFITLTNNTTQSVTTITPNVGIAPETPWSTALTNGHWAHAGYCVEVQPAGLSVTTGCGFGTFSSPLAIDSDGHFETDGQFSSSPLPGQPVPAHLSGVINNGSMALTIHTSSQTAGPFTVLYGSTEPCAQPCP